MTSWNVVYVPASGASTITQVESNTSEEAVALAGLVWMPPSGGVVYTVPTPPSEVLATAIAKLVDLGFTNEEAITIAGEALN